MSLRVCPIASVHAPVGRVWGFLAEPANYALWWAARTKSIDPKGSAQAGQRIRATSLAFGIPWSVEVVVERVDEAARTLDVLTLIPAGIILFIHISCTELDPTNCQISFGCEYSFSPVWWGWLLQRYAYPQLYAGVAGALSRLKQAIQEAT